MGKKCRQEQAGSCRPEGILSGYNPYQNLNVLSKSFTDVVKNFVITSVICLLAMASFAQKVDSIYFNLYTDSLKKGFYNYISVDGKLSNGLWQPLDSTQIRFTCNTGFFKGNDLFIDSTYLSPTVTVRAVLRSNPAVWREIVIYIRKRGFEEALKTNDQILEELRRQPKKSKSRSKDYLKPLTFS